MNKLLLSGAVCATSLFFSMASQAASFDFAGNGGYLGVTSLENNGVTATAHYYDGGWIDRVSLYQRDETNDHGLGVCSEEREFNGCETAGGNVNELGNQMFYEVIRLDKGDWAAWTSLWVSSLDQGDGVKEQGTLYWGDNSDIATLLNPANSFTYTAGEGVFSSTVEADIFAGALAAGLDATAQYLLFTPGTTGAAPGAAPSSLLSSSICVECVEQTDNDDLVWKGAVVPVPAAVWLFGSGLLGLVGIARRKKAA